MSQYLADPTLDALETFTERSMNWSDSRVVPSCYTRGRIYYTSPLLRTDFSKKCPSLPKLIAMIELLLKYICSLQTHEHEKADHPHVTSEIDLVRNCVTANTFEPHLMSWLATPIVYIGSELWTEPPDL